MSHKDICIMILQLFLSFAAFVFVVVLAMITYRIGDYFAGPWLGIPMVILYAYGVLHLAFYFGDRID